MTNCTNCKTRITSHLWVVRGKSYCSPSCERGKDSKFKSLLEKINKR